MPVAARLTRMGALLLAGGIVEGDSVPQGVTALGDLRASTFREFPPSVYSIPGARALAESSKNLVSADMTSGIWNGAGVSASRDFFGTSLIARSLGSSGSITLESVPVTLDPSVPYEFSVWLYPEQKTRGQFLFGLNGFAAPSTNVGVLDEAGVTSTDPYFWSGGVVAPTYTMQAWNHLRGYLVPASWSSADWVAFKERFTHPQFTLPMPTQVFRFGPSQALASIRFSDAGNSSGSPAISYWALPVLTPLVQARVTPDAVYTYRVAEAAPL